MPKILLILLISFLSNAIRSQNYNAVQLVIAYKSEIDTSLQPEIQMVLQSILEQTSANEVVQQVQLTASGLRRDIGEERMFQIVDFFEKKGIGTDKIKIATQYYDKEEVEVILETVAETQVKKTEIVQATKVEIETPKLYQAGASKSAQVFEIKPFGILDVLAKEGTKLRMEHSDFQDENGQSVKGNIQVELKEFYRPEDILLADLHTMDGEQILETGGMLNLKITANDKPLILRKDKSINIQLPTKNAKATAGMNLYLGTELANGAVDWKRKLPEQDSNSLEMKSYIKLKKIAILDSITYHERKTNLISNHYPVEKSTYIQHTHEEEYFDLELPYLPKPPVQTQKVNWGGIWINTDRKFSIDIQLPSIDPPPPPSVDILVQVEGVPINKLNAMGFSPKVALMLKDRSVFLRGNLLPNQGNKAVLNLVFERVPLEQELVLVAFLDTGEKVLYSSKVLKSEKRMDLQKMDLQVLEEGKLKGTLAELAN